MYAFMKNKTTISLILSLILAVLAIFTQNSKIQEQAQLLSVEAIPDTVNVSKTIVVTQDKIRYITDTKIVTKFIPDEGGLTINIEQYMEAMAAIESLKVDIEKEKNAIAVSPDTTHISNRLQRVTTSLDSIRAALNNPEKFGFITIKTRGLCARPQLGIGYNGDLAGYLGLKVAYWNRWVISIGSTQNQFGGMITRKLDFIPFTHNLEGGVLYGIPYRKDVGGVFVGINVNL